MEGPHGGWNEGADGPGWPNHRASQQMDARVISQSHYLKQLAHLIIPQLMAASPLPSGFKDLVS